jgi:acyl-CoA reductase-like NAD-dependent aldehyde dehydrogenase
MDTIDEKLKKAKLEQGFYNIIDGKRVLGDRTLSVVNPVTGKQLAAVPDVDHTLLDEAVSAAQRAFSGWRAVPTSQRKVILTSLVNRMNDHAEELSVLLTAEQGNPDAVTGTTNTGFMSDTNSTANPVEAWSRVEL